jgi:NAD(P)-dependent dehydrogenase (short-subunit alcohol dehydrogenase family)
METPGTAIVTGASKRIGADVAAALVERGWTVLAHVRRKEDSVPAGAKAVAAELSNPDCADRIFAAADGLPPVRLLVNNAARFAWDGFGEFDPAEFDAHMHANVRAPMLLMQRMAEQHPGGDALVVNMLDSKVVAPNPDFLSYTLSKHALLAASELTARALASRGLRVNANAPALMLKSPGQSDENFQAMHEHNPLRRGVTSADIVAAIDYLVASPVVTGELLTLDAGQRFDPPGRDVQFLET